MSVSTIQGSRSLAFLFHSTHCTLKSTITTVSRSSLFVEAIQAATDDHQSTAISTNLFSFPFHSSKTGVSCTMPTPKARRERERPPRNPQTSESPRAARGGAEPASSREHSHSSSDPSTQSSSGDSGSRFRRVIGVATPQPSVPPTHRAHSSAGDAESELGRIIGVATPQLPTLSQTPRLNLHRASPRNPAHQSTASTALTGDRSRGLNRAEPRSRPGGRARRSQDHDPQSQNAVIRPNGSQPARRLPRDVVADMDGLGMSFPLIPLICGPMLVWS